MKLVVDANILFSAFIKEGKSAELLLNPNLIFYTPVFVFEEIEEHKDEILHKTKRTAEELEELIDNLLELITLVPSSEIIPFAKEAFDIAKDTDDAPYIALALKLKCGIWSNDKILKEQKIVKVYSTSDLIELMG